MPKKTKPQKQRPMSELPPAPPQDLKEAVLFGVLSEITPDIERDYVTYLYNSPGKLNAKARQASGKAVLMMATLGFCFLNWQKNREFGQE